MSEGIDLEQLADLIGTLQDSNCEATIRLGWEVLESDPRAREGLVRLRAMARDCGFSESLVGWARSTLTLHRDLDRLLAAPAWRKAEAMLDPDEDVGMDYEDLLYLLSSRLAKGEGDAERLAEVRTKIEGELESAAEKHARRQEAMHRRMGRIKQALACLTEPEDLLLAGEILDQVGRSIERYGREACGVLRTPVGLAEHYTPQLAELLREQAEKGSNGKPPKATA